MIYLSYNKTMNFAYLFILIFSIFGMFIIDNRLKLTFFYNKRAASKSIIIMIAILLFIDVLGINWGIFSTNPQYVIGLSVGSENLPIEEFLFLFMLSYFILNLYVLIKRRLR